MGFEVWGLEVGPGLKVRGLGRRVSGVGISGLGFQGLGSRAPGFGVRFRFSWVSGFRFGASGLELLFGIIDNVFQR